MEIFSIDNIKAGRVLKRSVAFGMVVIAALQLSSCEPIVGFEDPTGSGNNIGFSASTSEANSRGAAITTETLTSMGVFSYTADSESASRDEYSAKMFNTSYVKDAESGIFVPAAPLDDDSKWSSDFHHFNVYAPYGDEGVEFVNDENYAATASVGDFIAIKYSEMSDDPTEHTDLLIGGAKNIVRNETHVVGLQLDHALSKVSFSAINQVTPSAAYSPLTIQKIDLGNLAHSAVIKYPNGTSGATWSSYDDFQKYSLAVADVEIEATQTPIFGDALNNSLFLIPQNLYDHSSFFTLHYTYGTEEVVKILPLPENSVLEMGKSYHYIFNIDPLEGKVVVSAQLLDWADSETIISEVTYTYLNLEKANYTVKYLPNERKEIIIDFYTNVNPVDLSIQYDGTGKPTGNSVTLNKDDQTLTCVMYPNPSYETDEITIIAGIITTKVTIDFSPVEIIDYSDIGDVNDMLGLDDATQTTLVRSNCYFVNSSPDAIREYYIPIGYQINKFYPSIDLTNTDNWNVQTYAYDNVLTTNSIELQKVGDQNGEPCFIAIIPQDYNNPGNIVVSVTDATTNTILWTWHLWLTDYDANTILTTGSNGTNYKFNGSGAIYRIASADYSYHMDRNIGASAATSAGHGGLGGRGWLSYQHGRLAPIFGHQAAFADGSRYLTTRQDISAGGVSQLESIQNPSTVYYSTGGINWCSDANTVGRVWNDSDKLVGTSANYAKSIFDPSPLGWMIPPLDEYVVGSGWTVSNNGQTYKSMSGNMYYSTINIEYDTGEPTIVVTNSSYIWGNADVRSYTGGQNTAAGVKFGHYTTTAQTSYDKTIPYTLGAGIRPIFQFEVN